MARPIKNKDGHKVIYDSARKILIKQGLEQVTARNIATASGYGLGSIYSYFANINDLILQINGETIEALFQHLEGLNTNLPASKNKLVKLCQAYFDYAYDNKELWNAVMSYRRSGREKSGKAYQAQVDKITELVENIIEPYLNPGQKKHEMALLLWSSMQGIWHITMRADAGFKSLSPEQAKKMVEILVKNLFK